MWIFRVKRPPCSPPAFKASYVARGFSQRQGVDYFQNFSPTPKMTSLWAPREWHDTLWTTLATLGFGPSTADPSLFLRTDTSLPPFYVLVYIYDLVFATADTEALAHVKSDLQKRQTCTDLGELTSYLGLRITRDRARRTITLTQSHMVHQVLQRFGFQFSSPQPTPLSTGHSLLAPPSDDSVEPSDTSPTQRWTGKVGNASVFRDWGSRAFVRNTSADKLSSLAIPCGPAPSGVSQVDSVEPVEVAVKPVEVAVDSGTARGAEPAGAGPGGAEPGVAESEGAEPGDAELERVEPGGAESGGAELGGAESGGAESGGAKSGGAEPGGAELERAESGGPPGVPSRREPLSSQRLREWYARHCSHAAGATGLTAGGASGAGAAGGATGAGAAGAVGLGGAGAGGTGTVGGPTGVGATGGVGAVGAGAVATEGAVGGTEAGGAAGVVAGDPGAEGTGAVSAVSGGATWPRPYYVPLLQQVLGLPPSTGLTPPLLSPPPVQSQSQLQPASPMPGPSPYSGPTRGLTERRELESRPASPQSRPASPESCPALPVRAVCVK
ncbi:unnamed protein product [Closterium sp. NIES-54]